MNLNNIGYNFKLLPQTQENRNLEIQEIENIKNELSKADVPCDTHSLTKAIIYGNDRTVDIDKFIKRGSTGAN